MLQIGEQFPTPAQAIYAVDSRNKICFWLLKVLAFKANLVLKCSVDIYETYNVPTDSKLLDNSALLGLHPPSAIHMCS